LTQRGEEELQQSFAEGGYAAPGSAGSEMIRRTAARDAPVPESRSPYSLRLLPSSATDWLPTLRLSALFLGEPLRPKLLQQP